VLLHIRGDGGVQAAQICDTWRDRSMRNCGGESLPVDRGSGCGCSALGCDRGGKAEGKMEVGAMRGSFIAGSVVRSRTCHAGLWRLAGEVTGGAWRGDTRGRKRTLPGRPDMVL
jgi:hypothetical protein